MSCKLLVRIRLGCPLTGYTPCCTVLPMPKRRKRVKLVRHEMQFSPDMLAWLRVEAERQDTTVAAIVRQAVLLFMEQSKS